MKKLIVRACTFCVLLGCMVLPASAANHGWTWPVPSSNSLSSCFEDGRNHNAIDIAAPKGSSVIAAYEGKVIATYTACNHNYSKSTSCGCGGGLGNYVYILSRYNGSDYVSRYGHLTKVSVSNGQSVAKGQTVGTVGSTGYSGGFHLDYQLYIPSSSNSFTKNKIIDPLMDGFLNYPSGLNANAATTNCCYTYVENVLAKDTSHTCNKGEYVYYWKAHPHYSCYKCSVCGKIWEDRSTSRYVDSCSTCQNHICDKGQYVYYWKAHPHPSCYKCSLCGEVWADHSTTNYSESCETCKATITISGENVPGTLTEGHGMNIRGTISSSINITNVTVGCYDHSGKMLTGKSVTPNSKSFNVNSIDSDVRFSSLDPGVYTYRISATNSGGTKDLAKKAFIVLSNDATVDNGVYSILSNSKSCAVSAVSRDSHTNIELAKVDSNSTMQQFKITYVDNGYYTIQNISSGKFLDVYNASTSSGTNIHQCTGNGTPAQRWQILPVGNTYCLVAQCATTNCMDVYDGDISTVGANIWNYSANLSAAQRFYLQEITSPTNASVVTNEFAYTMGDTVKITPSAKGATRYTISVYYGNAGDEMVFYDHEGFTGSISFVPPKAGSYTVVVSCYNGNLYADATCSFKVEDPETTTPEEPSGAEVHFPRVSTYTQGQFTDVPAFQWFTNNVAEAVEFGLMKGNSETTFNPYGDVTLAETITMAARIHSIYTAGAESFAQTAGNTWYQVYLDYAYKHGIISQSYYNADVTEKATRAQYAEIFANALPAEALYARNNVANNAIPDVSMSDPYADYVYKLYRAGILAGGDVQGTFSPLTYITRAESATIVSRMADTDNRMDFSLT